jgi:hypothetical protein
MIAGLPSTATPPHLELGNVARKLPSIHPRSSQREQKEMRGGCEDAVVATGNSRRCYLFSILVANNTRHISYLFPVVLGQN